MPLSRRDFLAGSSAVTLGFFGLRALTHGTDSMGNLAAANEFGYGPLVADPHHILDLPKDFSYRIISRAGDQMDDGYLVPGKADGMAAFAGPDGTTIIIRNHEMTPYYEPGPFGEGNRLLKKEDAAKLFDLGGGSAPHRGGTTTLVYDTKNQRLVRQFLSLGGTTRNCAGGPTPWNSWVTCEETVLVRGPAEEESFKFESDRDHGYNFEVPASAVPLLTAAVPLIDMGRFHHEAIGVDPRTKIVYETEDREDGLLYRFLPNRPGELAAGGKLQALVLKLGASTDTRNWEAKPTIEVGQPLAVEWLDMSDIQAPKDDLRYRGFEEGAARFARGEGMWYGNGELYIACTNGGRQKKGQIWRYVPGEQEGAAAGPGDAGTLELFIEPNDSELIESADNLTVAPWGDLVVCEDRNSPIVRLVGVTPAGQCYTLANHHAQSEFAGATFSPDGSTLFVNIQHEGLTLAITGPWENRGRAVS